MVDNTELVIELHHGNDHNYKLNVNNHTTICDINRIILQKEGFNEETHMIKIIYRGKLSINKMQKMKDYINDIRLLTDESELQFGEEILQMNYIIMRKEQTEEYIEEKKILKKIGLKEGINTDDLLKKHNGNIYRLLIEKLIIE